MAGTRARALVERLGGHPARGLGDPAEDAALFRWWLRACLRTGADEKGAARAAAALEAAGLAAPAALADRPDSVAGALREAERRRPEAAAAVLVRAARTLRARHGGSLLRLLAEADDFADAGGRMAALASGVGRATVLRFLRPLRHVHPAAAEAPLDAHAKAAAVCLGWLTDDGDPEGEPAALRAALREEADAPPLADVEAALERLGRAACRRGRASRCPLGPDCPRAPDRR